MPDWHRHLSIWSNILWHLREHANQQQQLWRVLQILPISFCLPGGELLTSWRAAHREWYACQRPGRNPYGLQFSASGGTSPYTFTLATGSTLPSGLNLSASGYVSGTLPTTTGNINFTVQAQDSSSTKISGTGTFAIPVSAGPDGSQTSLLSGSYTWYLGGIKDSDGSRLAMVGTITVDGNGNVTSGAFDINTSVGSFMTTGPVTGTYKIGSDWRGILKLNWGSTAWQATPNSGTPSTATVPSCPLSLRLRSARLTAARPMLPCRRA